MYHISPTQIKAARAMLGWLQEDLAAAANLSVTTIRSLETGHISPRSAKEVRKAFEKSGLEFIESDGVKRRDNQIKIYKGLDCCDKFFDDVLQTVREKGGEVVCVAPTLEVIMQSLGASSYNLNKLELLAEITDIKCLVVETCSQNLDLPILQVRTIPKQQMGPSNYIVYGDKYAHIMQEGRMNFSFVVFNMALTAQDHRNHFVSMWEKADWHTVRFAKKRN